MKHNNHPVRQHYCCAAAKLLQPKCRRSGGSSRSRSRSRTAGVAPLVLHVCVAEISHISK